MTRTVGFVAVRRLAGCVAVRLAGCVAVRRLAGLAAVRLAGLAAVAALLVGAGCAGSDTRRPSNAVEAYAKALHARDYDRAYALMSVRFRREVSREEFVRMLQASPGEVRETAARLRGRGKEVEVMASLPYGDLGDTLMLVEEKGRWRIASDPLLFYSQETPGLALRSFLRALENRRWDVVLRFIPNDYRKYMDEARVRAQFEGKDRDEQLPRVLTLLRGSLDSPIDQQGDQARLTFGQNFEVRFRREDGVWKIEELY